MSSVRTKFQVVALLVREERARVKADEASTEAHRAEQLKRLDGVATILAKSAARDTSLLVLLAEDARSPTRPRRSSRRCSGPPAWTPAEEAAPGAGGRAGPAERRVVPQSVISRQLANPFLVPDFSAARQRRSSPAGWPPGSCSARCSGRSSTAASPRA